LAGVEPSYRIADWLWMSFPIGISNVQNQLLQRSDALILALFVTPAEVGIYGMAARLAVGVGQCKFAFSRYWSPVMAGRWEVRDHEGLQRVARRTARMSLLVSTLAAVALVLFGKWVLA